MTKNHGGSVTLTIQSDFSRVQNVYVQGVGVLVNGFESHSPIDSSILVLAQLLHKQMRMEFVTFRMILIIFDIQKYEKKGSR